MKLDDVVPGACYARAQRILSDVVLIRDEMGRPEDTRALPELSNVQPRECYFEALAAVRKAQRVAEETGVHHTRLAPAAPDLRDVRPGHVLELLDVVAGTVDAVKQRLGITEPGAEPAIDTSRQPTDVLGAVLRINRELSRSLERPFTPTDVYGVVALASTYATRLGGKAPLAPFERKRKPADCYARLGACLSKLTALVAKHDKPALAARGIPADVLPGDVYDLASLVLGEVAYLHALRPGVAPVHPFEPTAGGHVLPAHVDQVARTLETQLAAIQ